MISWREASMDMVNVGRCLEAIEQCVRDVRATGAVNDENAAGAVRAALRSARKMVRALESLEFSLRLEEQPR